LFRYISQDAADDTPLIITPRQPARRLRHCCHSFFFHYYQLTPQAFATGHSRHLAEWQPAAPMADSQPIFSLIFSIDIFSRDALYAERRLYCHFRPATNTLALRHFIAY
jgi:hypothetical protein